MPGRAVLEEGYNVVATSRHATRRLAASGSLVRIDGDIGNQETAAQAVEAAINDFGTIDVLVNNAGISSTSLSLTSLPKTSKPLSPQIYLDSSTSRSAR